jgi:formylglycine-generating enzyme required for sulfatase activity
MRAAAGALATVASMAAPSFAGMVTFGTGSNTFNMEFVTIGNSGNLADTDLSARPLNAGAVGYTYDIGKFEVSRDMINKYNANFGTAGSLEITLQDMSSFGGNGANRPATGISWNEAARFVNWLNDSQGFAKAYKFADGSGVNANIQLWQSGDAGYDENNKYRNSLAKYVLPSYNEWYKAAYYDPNKSGGAGYWDYANGSDTRPTAVTDGSSGAVYLQSGEASPNGPADVDQAGGLSPYRVMGLNGNAREWDESSSDVSAANYNNDASSSRGMRGGSWTAAAVALKSSTRAAINPGNEVNIYGFRVASLPTSAAAVPEPTSMAIFGLGALGMAHRIRRKSKA